MWYYLTKEGERSKIVEASAAKEGDERPDEERVLDGYDGYVVAYTLDRLPGDFEQVVDGEIVVDPERKAFCEHRQHVYQMDRTKLVERIEELEKQLGALDAKVVQLPGATAVDRKGV